MNGFVAAKLGIAAEKTTDTHNTKTAKSLTENTFTEYDLLKFYKLLPEL
jgi:hypothetical protein